jgi:hypothetical protein
MSDIAAVNGNVSIKANGTHFAVQVGAKFHPDFYRLEVGYFNLNLLLKNEYVGVL